jgi:hypothetical protein
VRKSAVHKKGGRLLGANNTANHKAQMNKLVVGCSDAHSCYIQCKVPTFPVFPRIFVLILKKKKKRKKKKRKKKGLFQKRSLPTRLIR